MLFKIDGNLSEIEPAVKEFCEMATEEWTRQLPESREKLKKLKLPVPVRISNPEDIIPDELLFVHWVDGDSVFMRIPIAIPMQRVFRMPRNKAQKNLEGFLKAKGIKAKVKYMGD